MPELSATEVKQVCNEASRRGWKLRMHQTGIEWLAIFMHPTGKGATVTKAGATQREALATAAEALRLSWYDSNEESQTPFGQTQYKASCGGATAAGSGSGIQFTQEDLEDIMRRCGAFNPWK